MTAAHMLRIFGEQDRLPAESVIDPGSPAHFVHRDPVADSAALSLLRVVLHRMLIADRQKRDSCHDMDRGLTYRYFEGRIAALTTAIETLDICRDQK